MRRIEPDEIEFVRKNYSSPMQIKEIAAEIGRTEKSVSYIGKTKLKLTRFYVREFYCRDCGKKVRTDGKLDRRTTFCSASCEKKFWRHPTWENKESSTTYQGGIRHALSVQDSENRKNF